MISYKVNSVGTILIDDKYITSFKLIINESCIDVKLLDYGTCVVKKSVVKDRIVYDIEVLHNQPIKSVDIVFLFDNIEKITTTINLTESIAKKVSNYFKTKIGNNIENPISRILSGSINGMNYAIDRIEFLPKYRMAKIVGWAFDKDNEITYMAKQDSTLLGNINYRRKDVSEIYSIETKVGFEAICKTEEYAESIIFGLKSHNTEVFLYIEKKYFDMICDEDIQRREAEKYYVSIPYVYNENIKKGNDELEKNVDIIVACNGEKWLKSILSQVNKWPRANLIIASNKKNKDNFLKIKEQFCLECKLVFGDEESKEELEYLGLKSATKKYFMFLEQEDELDSGTLTYLISLCSENVKIVCADYDLKYSDKNILRVVRSYSSWIKENPELLMISCLVDASITKIADSYKGVMRVINELSKDSKYCAFGNCVGYHYNCVENNWYKSNGHKQIAFYLTQYHENEENNKWWGKGFTEWTNVKKAEPMFDGHHQPRNPGELGYYDLVEEKDIWDKQTKLAMEYGIDGFCFYYYWFNGKRLLKKPLDVFIERKDINFSYCICWANESWTRRWDGLEHEILMEQVHNEETDIKFIYDVIPMFRDSRYVRVDGKPLLLIYRMELFPNPTETISRWRQICRDENIGEIHISLVQSFAQIFEDNYGADSATEFPPHKVNMSPNICVNDDIESRKFDFTGNIYNYELTVNNLTNIVMRDYCLMQGAMIEWDNTARRGKASNIFTNFSPELFRIWCIKNHFYTKLYNYEQGDCMFINAWNEWAEGSYLEPDEKYGRTMLEITKEVSKLR